MSRLLPALAAFTAGLYFSACQVGYFIALEFHLSSTFISYFSVIGMWLLGGLAGLSIPRRSLAAWLALGGLAAYYLHGLMAVRFPYDLGLLPLSLGCMFLTALYSGYFFRHARAGFASVKTLFFLENNGFLIGYFVAFTELLLYGQVSQWVLPAALAGIHVVAQAFLEREGSTYPGQMSTS